ncbi:MAG: molybdopterin-dependent oxidoreductase [SAR324 cluster bacterium]|nr:molybdopterin-dependent oxidoreductase [SAR324 cluster bacterium]
MKKGLSRRNLFKYMAVSGAAVTAASCQNKPEKLIPLLVPPEGIDYSPHNAFNYMTTCRECDAGCGMMVTAREGRAQKAEGNPLHPVNQGKLCARGQSSLQALYNPARLTTPALKGGKNISWEEAEKVFVEKIQSAQGSIVYLGRPTTGSDKDFMAEWLNAVGGGRRIGFQVFNRANLIKANEISFGRADVPLYHFDKARYFINFGADFLENWGGIVENARQFAAMHAYADGHKNKAVHVGPHLSLSGSSADEWVPVTPGTEGLLALSMAHEIRRRTGGYVFLADYLAEYLPEKVAGDIGLTAEKIKTLAKEFVENGPSLAIGGGSATITEQATETMVAVNILNAVSGNLGKTVSFVDQAAPEMMGQQNILNLIQELQSGQVKLLIIDESNPVYALPKTSRFADAMKNAFVVVMSSVQNETSHEADLVLPTLTPYESWGDVATRSGIRSIIQPVMSPVQGFDAKAREDVLMAAGQKLNPSAFEGMKRYLDYLKQSWTKIHAEKGSPQTFFEDFWVRTLENGGLFDVVPELAVELNSQVTQMHLKTPQYEGKGLTLIPSTSVLLGDGSGANKPWLQEVPDPMTQIVWDSWAEINPETAEKLGIHDRDLMEVKTPYGQVNVTAYYHFGIHKGSIAIPFGQGHENSGLAADRYGVNVLDLLPAKTDRMSGELAWLSVNAEVKKASALAYAVNMDGNARQLGRDIAAAVTITELAQGPVHHQTGHKRQTEFYPDRKETAGYYEPYKWGMTIDLDKCNGCSACVVACYSENNIPVVGKERMGLGREMSWIRLERYIEGYGENLETRFVPMTCQQCENAGCEPVCPVYATYHNPEGLNVQAYNRCVGTRYCSNNCIYKVRRFNWFDYEFPAPLHQQLNSTITTRSVGVMEKCTFCIQRIAEAKFAANEMNRDVQDGEIITACQQTCPTSAITFGNLADSSSQVSKLAQRDEMEKRDRQYEIIAEMNYKPAITYLKKVNFRETAGAHATSHHAMNILSKNEKQEA